MGERERGKMELEKITKQGSSTCNPGCTCSRMTPWCPRRCARSRSWRPRRTRPGRSAVARLTRRHSRQLCHIPFKGKELNYRSNINVDLLFEKI